MRVGAGDDRAQKKSKENRGWGDCLPLLAAAAVGGWLGNVLIDMALCRPKESIWENDSYASVAADVEASYKVSDKTQENMLAAYEKRQAWLARVKPEQETLISRDGYELVANVYPGPAKSHKWALLLHGYGYTGRKEEMEYIGAGICGPGLLDIGPGSALSWGQRGGFHRHGLDGPAGYSPVDRLHNCPGCAGENRASRPVHGRRGGLNDRRGRAAGPGEGSGVGLRVHQRVGHFFAEIKGLVRVGPFPVLYETNLIFQLRGGYNLRKASVLSQVAKSRLPILFIHGKRMISFPRPWPANCTSGRLGRRNF